MLRNKYGWEGEGKFWALNNRIAQAENCCLNITKKYNKASIATDLGFKIEEFDEYILFLIIDCELVNETEEGLTTDTIQENFLNVSEKRMRNKIGYQNRQKSGSSADLSSGDPDESIIQPDDLEIQPDELTQSKVKESKVKDINNTQNENLLSTCFSFEEFWDKYNKKIDKKKCEKIYSRLKELDKQMIKDTIVLYLKANNDPKFRKYPQTYLNGRNWEDDLSNTINNTNTPKSSTPSEKIEEWTY